MGPEFPPFGHFLKIIFKADAGLYTFLKIEDEFLDIQEAMPDVEVNQIIDECIDIGNEVF